MSTTPDLSVPWRSGAGCGDQEQSVEIRIRVWRSGSGCGDQDRGVEIKIGVWRSGSGCGDQNQGVEIRIRNFKPGGGPNRQCVSRRIIMAEKGLMLTQFEECFGTYLEHEVIKAILQSVDWDAKAAVNAFASMIDVSSIPGNVRAKISALSDLCVSGGGGNANSNLNVSSSSSSRASQNKNRNDEARFPGAGFDAVGSASAAANEWPQGKNFKSNNKNVNCKMTNLSRSPTFTNEHRNYDKFLSDFSQLRKAFSVSETNNVRSNKRVADTEKPTCMMQLIQAMLSNGTKIMVIMRGLPGSGKSTLARKIINGRGMILSADDYFMTASGHYNYNPDKISDAHQYTQNKARKCIADHVNPIVIDNTNLQKWEMRPYVIMAVQCNYKVEFIEPDTSWRYDCKQLARKTKHNVPMEKIEAMLDRFERNVKMKDFDIPAKYFSNSNPRHEKNFFNENSLSTYNKKVEDGTNSKIGEQNAFKTSPSNFQSSTRVPPRYTSSEPRRAAAGARKLSSPAKLAPSHSFSFSNEQSPSFMDSQLTLVESQPLVDDTQPSAADSQPSAANLQPSVANLQPSVANLQPSVANLQPSVANLQPSVANLQPSVVNLQPSVANLQPSAANLQPSADDSQPSAANLQPSAANLQPSAANLQPSVANLQPSVANLQPSNADSAPLLAYSDALPANFKSCSVDSLPSTADSWPSSNATNSCEVSSVVSQVGAKGFQTTEDFSTSRPHAAELPAISHAPENSVREIVSVYKESLASDYLLPSRESSPTIFDSDEFDDMVETFDQEVKKRMKKNDGELFTAQMSNGDKEAVLEDVKMYQFCEDLEDKLGDTISSMIRPTLVRAPEDVSNDEIFLNHTIMDPQNRLSLKVPDLDTVTEELSKDLSKMSVQEAGCASDATSNDASSVELVKEEGMNNEMEEDTEWNCVDYPSSACWDEETSANQNKTPQTPLEARPALRHRNTSSRAFKMEEPNVPCDEPDLNDGWVANFKTNSWDEEPDYAEMKKTGAVPKRCREPKPDSSLQCSSLWKTSSNDTKDHAQRACLVDKYMQTNLNHNSGKILEGNSVNFISVGPPQVPPDGPITKNNLRLEKGTMTDELVLQEKEAGVQHLKCFFPDIPDDSLHDILCRCNGNVDWAMNVLLDGGYELSDCDKYSVVQSNESGQSSPSESSANSSSEPPSRSTSPTAQKKQVKHRKKKQKAVWRPCEDLTFNENSHGRTSNKNTPQPPRSNSSSPDSEKRNPSSHSSVTSNSSESNGATADDYKNMNKVSLELDPLFALQLINLFGPVGSLDLNHSFNEDERRVYLPLRLCKEIHDIWNDAMNKDFEKENRIVQEYLDSDAACALQLQLEENEGRASGRCSPTNGDSFLEGFGTNQPPSTFQEVMELEKALQMSVKKTPTNSIALRLSSDRLCSEFIHVDPEVVKEALLHSNGRYDDAAYNLLQKFGCAPVRSKSCISELSEAVRDTDEMLLMEQKLRNDMELNSTSSGWIENTKDVWGEYELYRSLRKAALEKANQVTGPNADCIKSHYLNQASEFSKKMRAAETATHQVVLQQRNFGRDPNTLDLHVLTVPASLLACDRFLQERLLALQSSAEAGGSRKMTLSFITGWGKHSLAGRSKLKPAVKNFLTKKGYKAKMDQGNPGILTTTISL
ncbi:Smr domain [Trinorchestia longiramus]|nr:Smr domain [Trinorchestia longiramus]